MSSSDPLPDFLERVGSQAAFETLSELLPDAAVFVVDAERNVVHWSPGAEKLLGFRAEETRGRLCLASIRCRACMLGCGIARHGQVDGVALDLYRKDDRWIPTRKFARAFFDSNGAFAGGIEVLVPTGEARSEEDPEESLPLPDDAEVFHGLVTRDPGMRRAFQTIRNVAATDASVLVRGESGTGKELVARAIHRESHRSGGPFAAVNCAALGPALAESELFGHRRGAFTGAVTDRPGLFAQADGGTLFLDEVAELPLSVQGKLLRVLEDGLIRPLGNDRELRVDVRLVAATHKSLRAEVEAGRFREDLMYRLRVVPIFIPALRERRGDVDLLLHCFLREYRRRGTRRVTSVAPDAMRVLLDHPWPGNVRQLRNVVEYAFAVGRGTRLRLEDLPPELLEDPGTGRPRPRPPFSREEEPERIRRALEHSGGRVGEAARRLGMSRATFWRRRKQLGI